MESVVIINFTKLVLICTVQPASYCGHIVRVGGPIPIGLSMDGRLVVIFTHEGLHQFFFAVVRFPKAVFILREGVYTFF